MMDEFMDAVALFWAYLDDANQAAQMAQVAADCLEDARSAGVATIDGRPIVSVIGAWRTTAAYYAEQCATAAPCSA
jgi:hypothetical protein